MKTSASSATMASSSTNKIKPHHPLHNFPVDLRWTRKTHLPKPHSTAAATDEDPVVPPVDDGAAVTAMRRNPQTAPRGGASAAGGGGGSERQRKVAEDKRKIWISLTKEEIEEDVYSMTGARPRRPRKRPRNVQKLLDNLFPALYLVGMSAESYRVYDSLR